MLERILIQNIYEDSEIIRRLIDIASPLSGPTGYQLEIHYVGCNDVEPPVIYVELFEHREKKIFSIVIDQNTTLDTFNEMIHKMSDTVNFCVLASKNKTTYDEEVSKYNDSKTNETGELPF